MPPTNLPRNVYFFSLRSNAPIVVRFTQAELTTIERILASNGIRVKIELIENGGIIYLDDTFPKELFLRFKGIFLRNTQIFDAGLLPAQYMTWYDSLTGDTVFFAVPVEQYLQNKLEVIRELIGPEQESKLKADIYRRIVKEGVGPCPRHQDFDLDRK